jgi:NADPH2:quinone reductase
MRAIQYTRTGPSDVLQLVEREPRRPDAGEVSIRVVVSGVNPTDWKARQGFAASAELPAPQVPNQDGSGIIEAVGAGVTAFAPGDRVWVWDAAYQRTDGTAQEQVIIPAAQVVALPDGASFDVGASVGIPALTAHRALTSREEGPDRLAPGALTGCNVLVSGGAGAVGHAAIQLAVWAGATVITTVSSGDKAALASATGAHHVVNYREEDVAAHVHAVAPDGVDVIVEVNALANIDLDLDVLAHRGTISVYAGAGGDKLAVPVREAMAKNARLQFMLTYVTSEAQKDAAIAAVSDALRDGALEIGAEHGLPITRFPLEQTAAAHDAVKDGVVGKVLIDVAK